jgi:hypothetical protein
MISELFEDLIQIKLWKILLVLCLLDLVNLVVYSRFVWTDEIYMSGSLVSGDSFQESLSLFRKIDMFRFGFSPFLLAMQVLITASLVLVGLITTNTKVLFIHILKSVSIGHFFLILADYVKTLWLLFISIPVNRNEIDFFYPLGITNFIDDQLFLKTYFPILKTANIFELTFIIITSFCLKLITKQKFIKMIFLLLSTYGIGLVFFYAFVLLIKQ